jgi:hypothetical protein
MALHTSYKCSCDIPSPRMVKGQDSGLCTGCGWVYDPRLYEMRLREHCAGITGDDLDEILRSVDPYYARLVA